MVVVLYTCKDCAYYDSPKHGRRRRGLGYCRKRDELVSPYDEKCRDFIRKNLVVI